MMVRLHNPARLAMSACEVAAVPSFVSRLRVRSVRRQRVPSRPKRQPVISAA